MTVEDYGDIHEEIVRTRRAMMAKIATLADEMCERIARLEQRVTQLEQRLDARHVCPLCHGEKVVAHEGTGPDDPGEDLDCPICEGAGRLSDEELAYYEYYGMSLKAQTRPMSVGAEIPIN
jgi:hypothetical protein